MSRALVPMLAAVMLVGLQLAGCATGRTGDTLARLHRIDADTTEVAVDDSLELAMESYRRFLVETPEGRMTPEAMRRLADLEIEQQFGIAGSGEIVELPATDALPQSAAASLPAPDRSLPSPERVLRTAGATAGAETELAASGSGGESDEEFERRTTSEFAFAASDGADELVLPDQQQVSSLSGPLEAIRIYRQILSDYPNYERADQVLYQMARAYDEIGQPDEAMAVMQQLVDEYGYSDYMDEVQFRRGEYLFTRRRFRDSEAAYEAIIGLGERSDYYELALYKLGWALYKQEFYDEALDRFMGLLDYRRSIGYDFDQSHSEDDERRVADTFRVISLSFSNIGGPEVVNEYFAKAGRRDYEDRIYSNLGEFYLEKLRYSDAADVYASFVELNPFHRVAPRFSMRIIDIYGAGDFPALVVESKKDFATRYGLSGSYWDYFDVAESPEVLQFLKTNLSDLASYYHALYQEEALADERPANFAEAARWYREYLTSFPSDVESPSINYQLADLLLENEDYFGAAQEYERTAYDYDSHERASAAGYAAIFAYRENLKVVGEAGQSAAMRSAVDSSLRFADTFPEHENAPIVLAAAADDLYVMNDYETAIDAASKLIERYPGTDPALLRSSWTVVAHSSFDLERFAEAESAYTSVLRFVPQDDEERESLTDNLAASIYRQGEQANDIGDYRAAADHFLRIRDAAPDSAIRSSAEYDAAAALIRLEDWNAAGRVLEDFRRTFPDNELNGEVTKQLASVYRQAGELDRSASEYERVAAEATDPELQQEALLLAGELYEDASEDQSALAVYRRYVDAFPFPLDMAQETRNKMAGLYHGSGDTGQYETMLREIVDSDGAAGAARTDRSRYLAGTSALVLTEGVFDRFVDVELTQPFEVSLPLKQQRMDEALAAFEDLTRYEVSEVTAAATYYVAEIYYEFSRALLESERPTDLTPAELSDYELALEEQAYPFEERSISVHEENFDLIAAGVFNPWIERSLGKLATVMPGRYAKPEISSGFIGAIDYYVYRSPGAPPPDVAAALGSTDDGKAEPAAVLAAGDRDAR